jgi:hypothetical protein
VKIWKPSGLQVHRFPPPNIPLRDFRIKPVGDDVLAPAVSNTDATLIRVARMFFSLLLAPPLQLLA